MAFPFFSLHQKVTFLSFKELKKLNPEHRQGYSGYIFGGEDLGGIQGIITKFILLDSHEKTIRKIKSNLDYKVEVTFKSIDYDKISKSQLLPKCNHDITYSMLESEFREFYPDVNFNTLLDK